MNTCELLVLAAESAAGLRARAQALRDALHQYDSLAAPRTATAATVGSHRLAIVAASVRELATRLDAYLAGAPADGTHVGQASRRQEVAFVISGQGPEWWAMGRELYASEPTFAAAIHDCDQTLARHSQISIVRELTVPEAQSRLGDVEVVQPVLFALHVGLVHLLRTWGVVPDVVVGHSFGELSAAFTAGAITLDDAMRIHVTRTSAMKRLAGCGRMVVIETGVQEARRAILGLEDAVAIGVINSPESVVLSGEHAALEQALARLQSAGHGARPVPMPYAVHSPAMQRIAPELLDPLSRIAPRSPSTAMVSTVTGGAPGTLDARHWARNIGEPARFADAIAAILSRDVTLFVEIGPHPILAKAIAQNAARQAVDCLVLPSLRRQHGERATLLSTLGALATRGHTLTLPAVHSETAEPLARTLNAVATEAVDEQRISLAQQLSELGERARHQRLLAYLRAELRQRLALDRVDATTPLRELGLDSAMAVELAGALGAQLGRRLPATLFFEYPTLDAVARWLTEELGLAPRAAADVGRPRRPSDERAPIAIVGIGCRFPGGVDGPDALWRLLIDEVDAVTELPASRWDVARSFDSDAGKPGKTYSKWAGLLTDVDQFDARFFGIAPREAQSMDPQQRLLLEVSWEALEHAAIAPGSLSSSRTGVFIGLCTNDYGGPLLYGDPADIDAYTFTGNSPSVAAGRIAYVLGLQGPALVVDTACSSSLVALHLACRSLRLGECELALAGGVNLILSPALMIYFSRLQALSPTGRSRAFDAAADGYVRGEGCGVVVLKRLADARAAGDRILAVVRGSAVNQDGRSNGLTAPSGTAQQAVIRAALEDAAIAPSQVGYVEAHGTGTPLGDPIELRALGAALGSGRSKSQTLVVGSIKTNCGHAEGAAGIAGVIKAALALRHQRIPRSLHFQHPNPHIPWSELPVRVADTAMAWASSEPRIAGVSSFGFSGTNAHVLLEEAPAETRADETLAASALPVLLSARSERGLRQQLERLQDLLKRRPQLSLPDVARTLATARTHFEWRAGVAARDRDGLLAALENGQLVPQERRGGGLALLLPGQGSQHPRMGASLYAHVPVFRQALDEVLKVLEGKVGRPLAPILLAEADPALDETAFTQPVLFAFTVALFRLFESWGITADWLVGHSLGELSAAHISGVLDLEDACTLVAARGRLMQALPPGGAMFAIAASEEEVRPFLIDGEVDLAAVNGPREVVLSGDAPAVARAADALVARGRRVHRLRTSHAFHSARMDAMLDELLRVAATLRFAPPRIPIVSTVSGRPAERDELCRPEYWVRQARATVRFASAVGALVDAGVATCLELGPRGHLSALAADCVPSGRSLSLVPALPPSRSEVDNVHEALVRLHVGGAAVDWRAFFAPLSGRRIELPTYPFQRERYWIEPSAIRGDKAGAHPWITVAMPLADTDGYLLSGTLERGELRWLSSHKVAGTAILPATAFLDLALEAAQRVGLAGVEELTLEAPLPLPDAGACEFQVMLTAADAAGRRSLTLHARSPGGAWQRHASGALGPRVPSSVLPAEPWPPPGSEPVALEFLYSILATAGLEYGDEFRRVRRAWRCAGGLCVEVALDQARSQHALHPALLDAALHPLLGDRVAGGLKLPFSWTGVWLHQREATALRVHIRPTEGAIALHIADEHGRPVASIAALVSRPVTQGLVPQVYRLEWSTRPLPAAPRLSHWALVGAELADLTGQLSEAAVRPRRFSTLAALRAELDAGAPVPLVLTLHDDTTDVHAGAHRALEFLQGVLSDPRLEQSAAVLLTHGTLAARPGDQVDAVAQAAAAGLFRSVRAEHPQRAILHVDLDRDRRSLAALPAAVALGVSQVALRSGMARLAQLGRIRATAAAQPALATAGAVLVTGGTGALGQLVARHLAERHGVRELVLASRRGADAPGAAALRAALEDLGARVTILACDLSQRAAVAGLLSSIPRLRGIVHAAGVLDDCLLAALDAQRIDRVLLPKVDAALHLDALSRDLPLDYFVLFSSVAALLAPAGQASYVAANAALDALAHRRRAAGLPALAINFGPWAAAGMAARLGWADQARLQRLGLSALATADALAGLDAAPGLGDSQVAVAVLVPAARATEPAGRTELSALSQEEREQTLRTWVRAEAARALGLAAPTDVPWERPLRELGMDSLSAVELRNALAARLGQPLPATLVFDYPHVSALARWLADRIAPATAPAASVDTMSESELDALLSTLQGVS